MPSYLFQLLESGMQVDQEATLLPLDQLVAVHDYREIALAAGPIVILPVSWEQKTNVRPISYTDFDEKLL